MKAAGACIAALFLLPLCGSTGDGRTPAAQTPAAVPISSEPHHHLVLQNESVRVFQVEVLPHESTLLHQHDHDYVYVTIGDAVVTSARPDAPETHLRLADGAVNFSRGGFAHVARNDGDTSFRNVTIELLRPQGKLHNLCLQIVANEPASCPAAPQASATAASYTLSPQFETDETRIVLTRVLLHQQAVVSDFDKEVLLIAVDEVVLAPAAGKGLERLLRPGDSVWLGRAAVARLLKNNGVKEVRIITLEMKPHPSEQTPGSKGTTEGPPLKPPGQARTSEKRARPPS